MGPKRPIVAVDLGGTNLRVALMDEQATVLARASEPTRGEEGPERVAQRTGEMASRLLKQHGADRPLAVGASLASPLDLDGVMLRPPSLPGWERVPFRGLLAKQFDVPVWVGNDCTLAVLGEHVFGAGRGVNDLVYLTISSGVGGGAIVGGCLLLGDRGLGGEMGHIIIQPSGPMHRCGHAGCLEGLVSGPAIARRAVEALRGGGKSALRAMAGGKLDALEPAHVFRAAADGDGLAREVVEAVARDLGLGMVSIVHVFNPRRFIIGGGVSQNWAMLEPTVLSTMKRIAMPGFLDRLEITITQFGDDVGLVGAVALVLQEMR